MPSHNDGTASAEPQNEDTPVSLLDGLRGEDEDAWARFVELWLPSIYGACRSRGFSPDDADEISQSVMVRVYQGLPSFRRDGIGLRFRFWIMKILRNAIADYCRENSGRPLAVGGSEYRVLLHNMSAPESESDSTSPTHA